MNTLEQLKTFTTVVADTGDFNSIKDYLPRDATTNPSLILKSVQKEEYRPFFEDVVRQCKSDGLANTIDQLLIEFGKRILKIVPGRVSTEVDARLSFDVEGTVQRGKALIKRYEEAGISRDRVLIKIASTWEGICAAEKLEKEGIRCNMTLLFSLIQAIACAEARVQLISPFVGRIYDWFKNNVDAQGNEKLFEGGNDPGVQSVKKIFQYFKKFSYKTEIMGASFRNVSQILELAGCDLLTISPDLLRQMQNLTDRVDQRLGEADAKGADCLKIAVNEKVFRWQLNEDAMATEKLAEGIRLFAVDTLKLEHLIQALR